MLKSTYKPSGGLAPLPLGWSEHKAPTGHTYYYNAATKQSTYSRPTRNEQPVEEPVYVTKVDSSEAQRNIFDPAVFSGPGTGLASGNISNGTSHAGNDFGGRSSFRGHNNRNRPHLHDRPRSKHKIPDCAPWFLVTTKMGRRFVYNSEKGESFWKFPADVMKGVVEFDRLERNKKAGLKQDENSQSENTRTTAVEENTAKLSNPDVSEVPPLEARIIRGEDGEEYEEVEVTDDEDDGNPSKRQKTGYGDPDGPVEFNEDDIAYQLATMGQDYGLDPGEYGDGQDENLEVGAEGLQLTEDDAQMLFKDMLSDYHINPYTAWEKVVEAGQIVHDDRYIVLSNMKSRKAVWTEWSRDQVQNLKEQREHQEKKDPRIAYFSFLQKHGTLKLYWPEFRRKYKKEPELRDTKLSDKEREKLYRDYIHRLKLPESVLKSDLIALLKSVPLHFLNRDTLLENLPSSILTDTRYISLRPSIRDGIIEAYVSSLPAAPAQTAISAEAQETLTKERTERERRDRALAERQRQVQKEKKRQKDALEFSKGVLREGEEEIEIAMRVGKDGLRGYLNIDE